MACHCINNIADYSFIIGKNIDGIHEEYAKHKQFIEGLKDYFFDNYYTAVSRMCLNYKGLTDNRFSLNCNDSFQEDMFRSFGSVKL